MTDPESLIAGWLDGELNAAQQQALLEWLKADESHVRVFVEAVLFDRQIQAEVLAREEQQVFSRCYPPRAAGRGVSRPVYRLTGMLSAAVIAGAAVIAALVYFFRPPSEPVAVRERTASAFCQVLHVGSAAGKNGAALRKGDWLSADQLTVSEGALELLFDNGVRAICQGPAELELRDLNHAWLHAGRAMFRVPPSGIGFTVETDDAVIVDLGTEFGVRVGGGESTELQVYDGEVIADAKSVAPEAAGGSRRILGGQATRIGHGEDVGETFQEMPFRPEWFVFEMPDPMDHPEAAGTGFPKKSPYNKAMHEEIRVRPAPRGVTIDGSLDDWDLAGQFASECPPPWTRYYHVKGALMYDREHLYIGAIVADPFPMRSTVSPKVNQELYGGGGSVVLRLSADRATGWPVRATNQTVPAAAINERLASLVMWYHQAESQPCLDLRYGIDLHGRRLNPAGFRGAWTRHPDGMGYTMEYAIPWSLLNAADDPPRAGDTLACTWLVHWSDSGGQNWRGQLIEVVKPGERGWNFENAATWGRAVYEPAGNGR